MPPRCHSKLAGRCIVKIWLGVRVLLVVGAVGASMAGALLAPGAARAQDKLVFCSDIAFPPMEFFEGSNPIGADIDIGNEVAKRIGREAEFSNVGFDAIIAALQGNRCDAIISGMNDTPERAKQVDFVDYLSVGQSLVVPKGNPLGISDLLSLCGHAAGAQVGTTNLDTLNKANDDCAAAGKPAIDVTGYKEDSDALLALKADRIDVYETDSSVAAYYVGKDPDSFVLAGHAIDAVPVGIALRKDSTELRGQIQKAIEAMYADGTMMQIFKKWNLQEFALPSKSATPVATPA
jgi:polar amino acid transport system substrate-binding protein